MFHASKTEHTSLKLKVETFCVKYVTNNDTKTTIIDLDKVSLLLTLNIQHIDIVAQRCS